MSQKRTAVEAAEVYATHVIVDSITAIGMRMWLIRRADGSNNFETRIIAIGKTIIITGDGPGLIAWGGPDHPVAKVGWFAHSGLGYLRTKLRAGPGCDVRLGVDWDGQQAHDDLTEELAAANADAAPDECGFFDTYAAEVAGAWESVIEFFDADDGPAGLWRLLSNHIDDYTEYSIGEHIASFMYYAQAACQRLAHLIGDES